ncbi:MAG: FAD-binding oxidoreductase [Verrucomicrobia bacterium]|nr:FAD-binding oxidoreductase [Verrucomicrobiota bacterium]
MHKAKVEKIQSELRGANQPVSLAKSSLQSNTTRPSDYKKSTKKLSADCLNQIISIDPVQMVAVAEPRVSMLQLAQETFKQGLIPLVVPEFKGITVGGAIMGCGGESSSHNHGLFHDICNSFELLLGDATVVTASKSENRELFEAIPGSYGSLGMLLSAEIRLQRALPWVTLEIERFSSGLEAIERMRELINKVEPPEYCEGIIFSENDAALIVGRQTEEPAENIFSDGPFAPWYYAFIQKEKTTFSVPLIDYLFRHDRGAFWMGAYVLHAPILKKLFAEGIWKLQNPKPFTAEEQLKFSSLKTPTGLLNPLTYSFTTSQKLFRLLHSCEDWVNERFIVQDFTFPEETVSGFLAEMQKSSPLYPLWLCPVKAQKIEPLFAPHSLNGANSINIGIYGIPNSKKSIMESLRDLESALHRYKGKKWLYTNSTYTPEEFWSIYDHAQYTKLRKQYNAENVWVSIENKVL